MLEEDAFRVTRRYHEDLLWPRPMPDLHNAGSGTIVYNTAEDVRSRPIAPSPKGFAALSLKQRRATTSSTAKTNLNGAAARLSAW